MKLWLLCWKENKTKYNDPLSSGRTLTSRSPDWSNSFKRRTLTYVQKLYHWAPPPQTLFVITIYEICDKPPSIVRNIILVKMINTSPWKWIEDVNTDVNDWEMIWRSMKAQLCISYNPMAREYLYLKPLRNSRTHSLYTYKQEIEK